MRKVEYVNRMILFHHITEEERDKYMHKDITELLNLYLKVIITHMEKNNE